MTAKEIRAELRAMGASKDDREVEIRARIRQALSDGTLMIATQRLVYLKELRAGRSYVPGCVSAEAYEPDSDRDDRDCGW